MTSGICFLCYIICLNKYWHQLTNCYHVSSLLLLLSILVYTIEEGLIALKLNICNKTILSKASMLHIDWGTSIGHRHVSTCRVQLFLNFNVEYFMHSVKSVSPTSFT